MNNTNIVQVLNTVADAVKANTDSQPFIIAQALLKVAALPNYTFNDSVVIAIPTKASDMEVSGITDYGVLSNEIMEALGSCGTKSAYFVPTESGKVKVTSEDWQPCGAEYAVECGKAYKYITGSGLIEV